MNKRYNITRGFCAFLEPEEGRRFRLPKGVIYGKDVYGYWYTMSSLYPTSTPRLDMFRWRNGEWIIVVGEHSSTTEYLAEHVTPEEWALHETIEYARLIGLGTITPKVCQKDMGGNKYVGGGSNYRHGFIGQVPLDVWEKAAPMTYGEANGKIKHYHKRGTGYKCVLKTY